MTKVISMSSKEILPELLRFFETKGKEGKCQTIRPAWRILSQKIKTEARKQVESALPKDWKIRGDITGYTETLPRFKEGELVSVQWHQRTSPKGSWFCDVCGNRLTNIQINRDYNAYARSLGLIFWEQIREVQEDLMNKTPKTTTKDCGCTSGYVFPKILGTIKIGKVFKIEMSQDTVQLMSGIKHHVYNVNPVLNGIKLRPDVAWLESLAKNDGFRDSGEMMKFFRKTYDLKQSRLFWVYGGWEYVEGFI